MPRIHGKSGKVLMDLGGSPGSPVGGAPYAPVEVADISGFTLNMSTDRVEVTAFGDTNKQRVAGLPDFSGDISGFWNSASGPAFFGVVLGGQPVFLRLMPNRNEPTYYFEGLANLDGTLEVPVNGAATITGTWDAAGNWTMNP
jgi:hypothetical protein